MSIDKPQKTPPQQLRDEITEKILNHDYSKGPLLLNAGPGTGKTHNIIETIRKHLASKTLNDFFVVSLTKAIIEETKRKINDKLCCDFKNIATLHSRAKGIVHRYADVVGWPKGFEIFSEAKGDPETVILIKDLHSDLALSGIKIDKDKLPGCLFGYQKLVAAMNEDTSDFGRAYLLLQRFYKSMGWYDLMKHACSILEQSPDALSKEHGKQAFILVDEYQDLNHADQKLLCLLNNGKGTLFAAGDANQSIYSFRHAYPDGMNHFEMLYPNRKEITLQVCSRCPTRILEAAFNVISRNVLPNATNNLLALPETDERTKEGLVCSIRCTGPVKEADFIRKALRILQDRGIPFKEVLILTGNKDAGKYLLNNVMELDGGLVVQDCLNKPTDLLDIGKYLKRFYMDISDNFALRILLEELSGINAVKLGHIRKRAIQNRLNLWETINLREAKRDVKRSYANLKRFITIVNQASAMEFQDAMNHYAESYPSIRAAVQEMLQGGVTDDNAEVEAPEDDSSLLVKPVTGYRFMTLHASKGLDADYIFIPFMEAETCLGGCEEDHRRLLYVGITRAKAGLIFTWSTRRGKERFSGGGGPQSGRKRSEYLSQLGLNNDVSQEKILNYLNSFVNHVKTFDLTHCKETGEKLCDEIR